MQKLLIAVLLGLAQEIYGVAIDSGFAVDPEELQLKEISENMRRMSTAVMGLTEYVMEIRQELRTIRSDIGSNNITFKSRPDNYFSRPIRDPEEVRRQSLELADKVEKLLAMDQSPEVDLAKEELRRTVEKNFLRMLAAILVTGPAHTQERSDDIFKLMRSVLNGELDFTPVVQRLPLILRDSETNQFVSLLITLRESERGVGGGSFRQETFNSAEDTAQGRQILANFPITSSILNSIPRPSQLLTGLRPANTAVVQPSQAQAVVTTNQNGQQVITSDATGQQPQAVVQQGQPQQQQQFQPQQQQQQFQPQQQQVQQVQNPVNTVNAQQPVAGTPAANRNQLPNINNVIEAIQSTNQVLTHIPSLVEGLQTIVETIEGIFG